MSNVFDALSPQQRTDLLLVYHILQLTGGVGMALVLGTIALAKSLKPRHPLAINMMFCWFLYALVSCILLFSGYSSQPDVPFALCLADAAVVNAVNLLAATSCTTLVIHLWAVVQSSVLPDGKLKAFLNSHQRGRTHIFLVLPYIVFVAWTVFLLVIGLHYPEAVSKREAWFYCTIVIKADKSTQWFGNLTIMVAGSLIMVAIIFEILIAKVIWKHKIQKRPLHTKGLDKSLLLRIGIFSGYSICNLFVVVLGVVFPTQVLRHIWLATIPLAAFLTFGPQGDLLACWFGWLPCYPRRPKAEWTAVPMTLATPYTPRSNRELFSRSNKKASQSADHQYPSSVAGIGISTIENRGLRYESHPPSHPTPHGTPPFPVLNSSGAPQTPIPRGERPPPYPPPGNSELGIEAAQLPLSAHIPRKQGTHSPWSVGVIRQSPITPVVPTILVQSPPLSYTGTLTDSSRNSRPFACNIDSS